MGEREKETRKKENNKKRKKKREEQGAKEGEKRRLKKWTSNYNVMLTVQTSLCVAAAFMGE